MGTEMEFDRERPDGGIEARCRIENGKARITWEFYLRERKKETYTAGKGDGMGSLLIDLAVTDRDGHVALKAVKCVDEEEPLEALLLHPRLWNGMEDPYLYDVKAELFTPEGCLADRVCMQLPLREIERRAEKEILLNGEPFSPRVVRYTPPQRGEICQGAGRECQTAQSPSQTAQKRAEALRLDQMLGDLQLLRKMGANAVFWESAEESLYRPFLQMCDKCGFLVWEREEGVPVRHPDESVCLLDGQNRPTSLYYRYRARWGRDPFVYLVPESIGQQKDGNYTATVYSNSTRVALYSDGILQGFQTGEEEFVFEGIPARHPCIALSAEAEGCSMALSLHKSYVKHTSHRQTRCLE